MQIFINTTGQKATHLTGKSVKKPNDYKKPHWHEKYIIYRQKVTKTSLAKM
jgi:hypothetical protein